MALICLLTAVKMDIQVDCLVAFHDDGIIRFNSGLFSPSVICSVDCNWETVMLCKYNTISGWW